MSTTLTTEIEAQGLVADTARVLDSVNDGWWRRMKDTGPGFSVFSADNCPLQQIYGSYIVGREVLEEQHGVDPSLLQGTVCAHYEDPWFVEAWREEIAKRNKEDEVHALTTEEAEERELVLATR
jgi:hypothetical protein